MLFEQPILLLNGGESATPPCLPAASAPPVSSPPAKVLRKRPSPNSSLRCASNVITTSTRRRPKPFTPPNSASSITTNTSTVATTTSTAGGGGVGGKTNHLLPPPPSTVPSTGILILETFLSPILNRVKKTPSPQVVYTNGPTILDYYNPVKLQTYEYKQMDDYELEEYLEDPESLEILLYPPPIAPFILTRPFVLPRKTRSCPPITLVLDLDETLAFCTSINNNVPYSSIQFPLDYKGTQFQVTGNLRPYCQTFLERVSKLFEVVVFTASHRSYGDKLLSIMDPKRDLIRHRLFRDSCVFLKGKYVKDLRVLGRELSKVIIVDNSPYVFAYQLENGIPIKSWDFNPEDQELLQLLHFLESIADVEDVRPFVSHYARLVDKIRVKKSVMETW